MLLATLPRLGQASPLRKLPRDVFRNIVKFVPWPRCDVRFVRPMVGHLALDRSSIEVSVDEWTAEGLPLVQLELFVGVSDFEYLEILLSDVWCGSQVCVNNLVLDPIRTTTR